MKPDQVAALLARTSTFEGTAGAALDALASQAIVREFRKGAFVVRQGDEAESCYILAEGRAKVFVTGPDGHDLILATLNPPDAFGVVALLDGGVRSASVEALEPLTVVAIARSTFMGLLRDHPEVADAVARAAGALVRKLTGQAADLVFLDLEGRVAKFLVSMAEEKGSGDADQVPLDLGVTQRDLAEMVGGSRQSVNQILHALAARGFLEMNGKVVTIQNLASLRRRAGM